MQRRTFAGFLALVALTATGVATTTVAPPVGAQSSGSLAGLEASDVPVVVRVNGGPVSLQTEQSAVFVFTATAGQVLHITANRNWRIEDPFGDPSASNGNLDVSDSGQYLVFLDQGLTAPATIEVSTIDPNPVVTSVELGATVSFPSSEPRDQQARVAVRGGQRYTLSVAESDGVGTVCAYDESGAVTSPLGCVNGSAPSEEARTVPFIPGADQRIVLRPTFNRLNQPPTLEARVAEAPNDIVLDVSKNPLTDRAPRPGQSLVIPFWGSPAERGVVSSPVEGNVSGWGQPWIDREQVGKERTKVFATPVAFKPDLPPFISWTGPSSASATPNQQRFGVYRGEDTAVAVTPDGPAVVIRNAPWFASVAAMKLSPGDRYALEIEGTDIRPISLGLRDPTGRFSSNLSPWQWSADGDTQRATTAFTADRAGGWALEMRPSGNRVHDLQVKLTKIGTGGGFEGSIDVGDVLTVGDATDVQLGPNEFARLTVKLTSPSAQIVQPEVLRYRNTTFQPTAADLSLWDSKGRLVWSNNRNLEEEVLSGRLGKEPELTEKFATVASADNYTLVVDPHGDIAGRFRVSVKSSGVLSDVRLGNGQIPLLLTDTTTGIVEVSKPTRYKITGNSACVVTSSTVGWAPFGGPVAVTPAPVNQQTNGLPSSGANPPIPQAHCLDSDTTLAFPPGVHRLRFGQPAKKGDTFTVVPEGSGPDPIPQAVATVGSLASLPQTGRVIDVAIDLRAGVRYVGTLGVNRIGATLVHPDGTRTYAYGSFVPRSSGIHHLLFTPGTSGANLLVATDAPEIVAAALAVGAREKLFELHWGQRLELNVTVKKSPGVRVQVATENGYEAQLLYAVNAKQQRFTDDDGSGRLLLKPGAYKLYFLGDGQSRITLFQLKPNEVQRDS